MAGKLNIDESIFCNMVRLYGKIFNLPPLAAKIYAYLIFDFERKGLTFDDLIEIFSASKSSVSTNLNLLLNNNLIQDLNKLDERKRYFTANENFVKIRFQEISERLKEEIRIINSLENFHKSKSEDEIKKSKIYKDLLNSNIENIEKSLSKL